MAYNLSATEESTLFGFKVGHLAVGIRRYGPFQVVENAITVRLVILITGSEQ
jgi:hypothetical protein